MKARLFALAVAVSLGWALPAAAQVKLQFNNGKVSLSAQNAQIRTILAEWARLGGTRIVNGERVTGQPVTLELTAVSEQQAMEILLRGTAGYMIGALRPATTGSALSSVMILPTSSGTTAAAPAGRPQPARAATRQPEPPPEPDPEEDPATDTPPDADDRVQNARQAAEEAARQRIEQRRQQIFVEGAQGQGQGDTPAAGNPFGLPAGAARPGVITAPPPQNNNGRRTDPEP